jgi:hypothetical protein
VVLFASPYAGADYATYAEEVEALFETPDDEFDLSSAGVRISAPGYYKITGSTNSNNIEVTADDVYILLSGVTIDGWLCGILLDGNITTHIYLDPGKKNIISGGYAAIALQHGASVEIHGGMVDDTSPTVDDLEYGNLEATKDGQGYKCGAVIGTFWGMSGGNITINGGYYPELAVKYVTNQFYEQAWLQDAIIGAGLRGPMGDITITGGAYFKSITNGNAPAIGGSVEGGKIGTIKIENSTFGFISSGDPSYCAAIGGGDGNDSGVDNITIDNVTFLGDIEGGIGGGYQSPVEGSISISHSRFDGAITRTISGAGIGAGYYNADVNGDITISDTTFGGVISGGPDGGAGIGAGHYHGADVNGDITISNTTFGGAISGGTGGAAIGAGYDEADVNGDITISNTTFVDTVTGGNGGAGIGGGYGGNAYRADVSGAIMISNTTFRGVISGGTWSGGAAIGGGYMGGDVTSITIDNTIFNDDVISGWGGAAIGGGFKRSGTGDIEIKNTLFKGEVHSSNNQDEGSGGAAIGGGTDNSGTGDIIITNSEFEGAVTGSYWSGAGIGGGYYNNSNTGNITIEGTTFRGNVSAYSNGAGIGGGNRSSGVGAITISGSTFTDIAEVLGGTGGGAGIGGGNDTSPAGDVTIINSTFANPVYSRGQGAGIGGGYNICNVDNITITNVTFGGEVHSLNGGAGIGGGYNSNAGEIAISDTLFKGAVYGSEINGGAGIGGGTNSSSVGDISISYVRFADEVYSITLGAGIGGGGLSSNAGNITITDVTFAGEVYSLYDGAGIGAGSYNASCGDINITDSTFGGNIYSLYDGAGIGAGSDNASCGDINIINSTFGGEIYGGCNGSAGIGAGYDNSHAENLTIKSSTFERDVYSVQNGAGIGAGSESSVGEVTISDTLFKSKVYGQNLAAGVGGGATNSTADSITIENTTFEGEIICNRGAGIGGGGDNSAILGDITITNSIFVKEIFGGTHGPNVSAGAAIGGGMENSGVNGEIKITGSTFNTPIMGGDNGGAGIGGGYDNSGTGTISLIGSNFVVIVGNGDSAAIGHGNDDTTPSTSGTIRVTNTRIDTLTAGAGASGKIDSGDPDTNYHYTGDEIVQNRYYTTSAGALTLDDENVNSVLPSAAPGLALSLASAVSGSYTDLENIVQGTAKVYTAIEKYGTPQTDTEGPTVSLILGGEEFEFIPDIAYYAIALNWRGTPAEYKVTYNVNGGTAQSGSVPDPADYAKGTYVEVTSAGMTKPGNYTFSGWQIGGGGTIYGAGTGFVMPEENVELIAKWVDNGIPTYLLTVTNGSGSGLYAAGDRKAVNAPTLVGRTFVEWEVVDDGGGALDSNEQGTFFQMGNGSATLTAIYEIDEEIPVLTVVDGSYNAQSRKVSATNPAPSTQKFVKWIRISGDVTFGEEQATATTAAEPVVVFSVNSTVQAVFEPKYTSAPSGGGGGGTIIIEKEVEKIVEIPASPTAPGGNGDTAGTPEKPLVTHKAYIFGDENGLIYPDRILTRASAAQLLFNIVDDENKNAPIANIFADIDPDAWYAQAVNYFAEKGLITGYPDGNYHPNDTMTRGAFAVLAAKFAKLEPGESTAHFPDISGAEYYAPYVKAAFAQGWIDGKSDGLFHGNDGITRAGVIALLNNVQGRHCGLIDPALNMYTDLPDDHWAFSNIIEASVTHTER